MTDEITPARSARYPLSLPYFLAIQAGLLIFTLLDFPVYLMAYRYTNYLTTTPWFAGWLILIFFGLVMTVSLAVSPAWRKQFDPPERIRAITGFAAGSLAGMVTLGLRIMPMLPSGYFWAIGGLAVLLSIGYWLWSRRPVVKEEMFP